MESIVENYTTLGALGVSFCILMIIVWKYINSIAPTLKEIANILVSMQKEDVNHQAILDNNTKALDAVAKGVEEVAKSNNNVANIVQILNATMDGQVALLIKNDKQLKEKVDELTQTVKEYHLENSELTDALRNCLQTHDTRGERVERGIANLQSTVEKQTLELKSYYNEKK